MSCVMSTEVSSQCVILRYETYHEPILSQYHVTVVPKFMSSLHYEAHCLLKTISLPIAVCFVRLHCCLSDKKMSESNPSLTTKKQK